MKRSVLSGRLAVCLGLLACVCWCAGCGPGAPPTGSISGKVTFNGAPVTTGVITLVNEQAGLGASGELDGSGNYRIESIRTGEYKVAVHRPPPPPGSGPEILKNWKLNIPDKYQDIESSGLTATIEEGENTADFGL